MMCGNFPWLRVSKIKTAICLTVDMPAPKVRSDFLTSEASLEDQANVSGGFGETIFVQSRALVLLVQWLQSRLLIRL